MLSRGTVLAQHRTQDSITSINSELCTETTLSADPLTAVHVLCAGVFVPCRQTRRAAPVDHVIQERSQTGRFDGGRRTGTGGRQQASHGTEASNGAKGEATCRPLPSMRVKFLHVHLHHTLANPAEQGSLTGITSSASSPSSPSSLPRSLADARNQARQARQGGSVRQRCGVSAPQNPVPEASPGPGQ